MGGAREWGPLWFLDAGLDPPRHTSASEAIGHATAALDRRIADPFWEAAGPDLSQLLAANLWCFRTRYGHRRIEAVAWARPGPSSAAPSFRSWNPRRPPAPNDAVGAAVDRLRRTDPEELRDLDPLRHWVVVVAPPEPGPRPSWWSTVLRRTGFLLTLQRAGAGTEVVANWDPEQVRRATAERLMEQLRIFLGAARARPSAPIRELPVLPRWERTLLRSFNDTDRPGSTPPVCELIRRRVRAHPERPAVVDGSTLLTYAELHRAAAALAHRLLDVVPDDGGDRIVNLYARRSWRQVVGAYGTILSGAAFAPIDPEYPVPRIRQMLDDVDASATLVEPGTGSSLPGGAGAVVELPRAATDLPPSGLPFPSRPVSRDSLAYVIWTSGSTGRPKCILQTHRCLSNFVSWQVRAAGLEEGLRILHFAPPSFDVSVQEIFHALASGGTLFTPPEVARRDPVALAAFLDEHRIELLDVPFSVLNVLVGEGAGLAELPHLRHVISAGEPLVITPRVEAFLESRPDVTLHNHYGPSETHMLASHRMSAGRGTVSLRAPVGRPIWNMRGYILDEAGEPVPLGVEGELFIAGHGLARGYADPEETRKRFVHHPGVPGERLFRTGDRARWLEGGFIDLLGRQDDQVKIRGNRVELGDVTATLLQHPDVQEAVVDVRALPGTETSVLVAHYVSAARLDGEAVRRHMAARLPAFMVPARFLRWPSLPRSPNGKLVRSALPDAEPEEPSTGPSAFRDRRVRRMAELWREVLGRSPTHPSDSFFGMGGDSLSAMRLVALVHGRLGGRLSPANLYARPTLAAVTRAVCFDAMPGTGPGSAIPDPAAGRCDPSRAPLTPAQRDMWLLSRGYGDSPAFNVVVQYDVAGPLSLPPLEAALNDVVRRHEVLRTRFPEADGEPLQVVEDHHRVSLEAPVPSLADFVTRPFNLGASPPFRCAIVATAPDRHTLVLALHHLVTDATSVAVLERELWDTYVRLIDGSHAPALPAPCQFRHFARTVPHPSGGNLSPGHADPPRAPADVGLPTDTPWGSAGGGAAEKLVSALDHPLWAALRSAAESTGCSLFSALLASVAAAVSRTTGRSGVRLGFPLGVRPDTDWEGQMGYFVAPATVELEIGGGSPLRALASRIHADVGRLVALSRSPDAGDRRLPWRPPGRFDVWVSHRHVPPRRFPVAGLTVERTRFDTVGVMGDVAVELLAEADGDATRVIHYEPRLFEVDTMELFAYRVDRALEAMAGDPSTPLERLRLDPLVREQEREDGDRGLWDPVAGRRSHES